MFNWLFGEFVEIFFVHIHLWSVIVILTTLLTYFYLLRKLHPIYSLLVASTMIMFSKSILEEMYFVVLGWFSTLDFLFIVGLIPLIYIFNLKFHFLKINKWFIICVAIQAMVFVGIFVVGPEYVLFSPYGDYNWLWALSKALGFWMWLPLIWNSKQKTPSHLLT